MGGLRIQQPPVIRQVVMLLIDTQPSRLYYILFKDEFL